MACGCPKTPGSSCGCSGNPSSTESMALTRAAEPNAGKELLRPASAEELRTNGLPLLPPVTQSGLLGRTPRIEVFGRESLPFIRSVSEPSILRSVTDRRMPSIIEERPGRTVVGEPTIARSVVDEAMPGGRIGGLLEAYQGRTVVGREEDVAEPIFTSVEDKKCCCPKPCRGFPKFEWIAPPQIDVEKQSEAGGVKLPLWDWVVHSYLFTINSEVETKTKSGDIGGKIGWVQEICFDCTLYRAAKYEKIDNSWKLIVNKSCQGQNLLNGECLIDARDKKICPWFNPPESIECNQPCHENPGLFHDRPNSRFSIGESQFLYYFERYLKGNTHIVFLCEKQLYWLGHFEWEMRLVIKYRDDKEVFPLEIIKKQNKEERDKSKEISDEEKKKKVEEAGELLKGKKVASAVQNVTETPFDKYYDTELSVHNEPKFIENNCEPICNDKQNKPFDCNCKNEKGTIQEYNKKIPYSYVNCEKASCLKNR